MTTYLLLLEENIGIFAWTLEYPITLRESCYFRDDLNSYYLLDKDYFSPLTEFRTGATQKIATFSIPKKEGYILQKTGLDAKRLSFIGFIFSTEAKPEDREAKRQILERAFKSNSPVRFEVEGEGTYEAILTGLTFEDIGGEPNAYRYGIEALEVGYADYSDHSNISHINSAPHTNYSHSDHEDHNDSSHTDHSDHSDAGHGNWANYTDVAHSNQHSDSYPHNDLHFDWGNLDTWTNYGTIIGGVYHFDYSDTKRAENLNDRFHSDYSDGGYEDWNDSALVDYGWGHSDGTGMSGHTDAMHYGYGTYKSGSIHNDWTNHSDYHDDWFDHVDGHLDSHSNWSDHSDSPHQDYSHDDISHSDWQNHADLEHSNWFNHQDGHDDWSNHFDTEA